MPKKSRKSWSQLTPTQKRLVVLGGALQLTLQGAALRDLRRRRVDEVKGPRWAWAAATFVNTLGPCAYFLFGRRRSLPAFD
ncbi:PLDc N-terminal domain-containing protein [Rothia sp. ARF10]|nr:PLDc N-terminal domain-containing protein [Rothia sp. ARF10]